MYIWTVVRLTAFVTVYAWRRTRVITVSQIWCLVGQWRTVNPVGISSNIGQFRSIALLQISISHAVVILGEVLCITPWLIHLGKRPACPSLPLEVNLADWTRGERPTSFLSDVSQELSPCLLLHVSEPWYVKTKATFVPE